LNEEKTKIRHVETEKVKYLGFYISRKSRKYSKSLRNKVESTGLVRRGNNASVIIEAPIDQMIDKLIEQKYASRVNNKVKPRAMTK